MNTVLDARLLQNRVVEPEVGECLRTRAAGTEFTNSDIVGHEEFGVVVGTLTAAPQGFSLEIRMPS